MTRTTCVKCGRDLSQPATGRPKRYCSPACRRATEYELKRLQATLTSAEREAESARRKVEVRDAGLAYGGGTLTPAIERFELQQATRRLAELEARLLVLLAGDDD